MQMPPPALVHVRVQGICAGERCVCELARIVLFEVNNCSEFFAHGCASNVFSGKLMTLNIWPAGLFIALSWCGLVLGQETAEGAKQEAKPNPAKVDVLRQLSTSFEEISQRSGKAVVQIFVRSYVPAEDSDNNSELLTAQNSSGSGIILSPGRICFDERPRG